MKRFLSILLSCSLICSNAFATDTTKSENKGKINIPLVCGLSALFGITGIAGITVPILLKKHHDKNKKQNQPKNIKKDQNTNSSHTQKDGITEEEKKLQEEEAKRQAEEEARLQAEEEARRQAEEEARLQAEEEARRQAEEELRRQEEEARRKREDEIRRQIEQDILQEGAEALLLPELLPNCKFTPAQCQFIKDRRAPADDVTYNGEKITSLPHIILTSEDMREYFSLFGNTKILFRGVHVDDADQYYREFLKKGLNISSTDKAIGGNAHKDSDDEGKRVYFSPDPSMSFKYSLANHGFATWGITNDTHCMYLASVLPTYYDKNDTTDICSPLPKHNKHFVLCMSYYSFKLLEGTKYSESDKKFLSDYDPLPSNASPIRKAIRGLQLWLLETGIVIKKVNDWGDLKAEYNPTKADIDLQRLKPQAA